MKFHEMSFEELEEYEAELLEKDDNYALHVSFYEEMYRRIYPLARKDKENYSDYLDYVRRFLVDYLIKYGAYLKMVYQKDDYTAESSLQKALKYDKQNPIAHYRLGFLAYKKKNYNKACSYFQDSLEYDRSYTVKEYKLNSDQLYYAHLYLTNSALHIAASSYEELELLPVNDNISHLPNLKISPFYEYLSQNEKYIEENAFYKVTEKEKTTCSRDKCDELFDEREINTLYLYFQDRSIQAAFNDSVIYLSPQSAEKLRYLLLKSSVENPVTRVMDGEVAINTFIQAMKRLRDKLKECGISDVIESVNYKEETAYYFNKTCPFVVMYRTDDVFEIDEYE
ncbi:tetratricopeptide repeat protein [Domibacillus tundrae]|uniref:tetratricopeptide repeat protein n=1 Tax=Domibacillus tundrae TaxID=1587527 RepID=UPI000617A905|nr:tetratricopeptide repeat protein [Domibacillus tundrae]